MEKILSLDLSFDDLGIGKINNTNFPISDLSYMDDEKSRKIIENHTEYSYCPMVIAAYRILKMLESLVEDDVIIIPIGLDESCILSSPEGTYKYVILSE